MLYLHKTGRIGLKFHEAEEAEKPNFKQPPFVGFTPTAKGELCYGEEETCCQEEGCR